MDREAIQPAEPAYLGPTMMASDATENVYATSRSTSCAFGVEAAILLDRPASVKANVESAHVFHFR